MKNTQQSPSQDLLTSQALNLKHPKDWNNVMDFLNESLHKVQSKENDWIHEKDQLLVFFYVFVVFQLSLG